MPPAIVLARAAIRQAPLTRAGRRWAFQRGRYFSNATVRQLLDAGMAVRRGDVVEAAP